MISIFLAAHVLLRDKHKDVVDFCLFPVKSQTNRILLKLINYCSHSQVETKSTPNIVQFERKDFGTRIMINTCYVTKFINYTCENIS